MKMRLWGSLVSITQSTKLNAKEKKSCTFKTLNGLYICPSQPHIHSKIMYFILSHCHYCLMMVIAICAAPTCRTCRKSLRTFTMRTSARNASNEAAGCPPMVTFCLCRLRTYCSACLSPPPPSTSIKKQSFVSVVRLFEYHNTGRTKQMYWNSTTLHSHFSFLLKTHISSYFMAKIKEQLWFKLNKLSSMDCRVLMCAVLTSSHGSAASCGICVHPRIGGGGTAGSSVTAPPVLQPDASTAKTDSFTLAHTNTHKVTSVTFCSACYTLALLTWVCLSLLI